MSDAAIAVVASSVVAAIGIVVPAWMRRGDRAHDLELRKTDRKQQVKDREQERAALEHDRRIQAYLDVLTYAELCVKAVRLWSRRPPPRPPVEEGFPDDGDLRGRVAAWGTRAVAARFRQFTDLVDEMVDQTASTNPVAQLEGGRSWLEQQVRAELDAPSPNLDTSS